MRPEFDSQEWRKLRDQKLMDWVGDPAAVQFILQFSDVAELFDDIIDQDKEFEAGHVARVLFTVMTEMPMNPFFDKFKVLLVPVMVTGINAWLDANDLEKGSDNDRAYSYVLRDWYCELINYVIYLTRGRDHMRSVSLEVRKFLTDHETLEQYREGFA